MKSLEIAIILMNKLVTEYLLLKSHNYTRVGAAVFASASISLVYQLSDDEGNGCRVKDTTVENSSPKWR